MKKFIIIGHFKGIKNITSVAISARTKGDVRNDCKGNEFIPWLILSEKDISKLKSIISNGIYEFEGIYEFVKKRTTNYHRWEDLTEYIEQCLDIMEEKLDKLEVDLPLI